MNASSPADLQSSFSICLVFILLVPFAIAGLALINSGLGRSRSAAHAMTASVCVVSIAVLVYFVFGFAVGGYPFCVSKWFLYAEQGPPGLFLRNLVSAPGAWLCVLLGLFSVGLTSLIPVGAGADRWRLSAACASTVALAGVTYPLFVRCLSVFAAAPGVAKILGQGIMDARGSGVINITGGLTALSIAWLLGPRRGKYSGQGLPAAIPAHNGVYVLFGCMLAWVGWIGLNSAGAIIYVGIGLEKSALAAINTTFSAAAAAITAAAVTRIRFRKPDASLIANGWMAGLVASSAGCATLKPGTAILTGLVAGTLVVFSVELLEFTLKIDDPCGSISVHAVCGIWGMLAAGIFAESPGQFLAQLVGVATLLGVILPMTYFLNWLLGRFIPHRVSIDGERQGMDLHELGADAYPEFVIHADEFIQR